MEKNEKSKTSWTLIIMGIVIFVLFVMYQNERGSNEKAKKEFSIQTAQANYQDEISINATQAIKNKIKDCMTIVDVSQHINTEQCVYGFLIEVVESTEPRDAYTAPEVTYGYFDLLSKNAFYIVSFRESNAYLNIYENRCVKVWGLISRDGNGTPAMSIYEQFDGFDEYVNIEVLPDILCL